MHVPVLLVSYHIVGIINLFDQVLLYYWFSVLCHEEFPIAKCLYKNDISE